MSDQKLIEFARSIASLTTASELDAVDEEMSGDDACATLSNLIDEARKLIVPYSLKERRKIKPDQFTRINNDVNGNPRYVLHFLNLATDAEHDSREPISYPAMIKRANRAGGRKYHNKQYGGGLVFQSYSLDELCEHLNALREGK